MLTVINSFKMSEAIQTDDSSDGEELDGFIASVLQDMEIKDALNDAPEGTKTAATSSTQHKDEKPGFLDKWLSKLMNDSTETKQEDAGNHAHKPPVQQPPNTDRDKPDPSGPIAFASMLPKLHQTSKSETQANRSKPSSEHSRSSLEKSVSAPTSSPSPKIYPFFDLSAPPLLSPKRLQQQTMQTAFKYPVPSSQPADIHVVNAPNTSLKADSTTSGSTAHSKSTTTTNFSFTSPSISAAQFSSASASNRSILSNASSVASGANHHGLAQKASPGKKGMHQSSHTFHVLPSYSPMQQTKQIIAPITSKRDYEMEKKMAIKKICDVLHEMDEDKNGEIDFEEFQEGMTSIYSSLLPSDVQQIYSECVWNEDDELNIQLFSELLQQRCKDIDAKQKLDTIQNENSSPTHKISPRSVIQWAFASVVNEENEENKSSSSPEANLKSPSIWGQNVNPSPSPSPLKRIHEILQEKDDDENLLIDWNEFKEAMSDLGVIMSAHDLRRIFKAILAMQRRTEELNINKFMKQLAKQKGVKSMRANQVLQLYFTSLLPTHSMQKSVTTMSLYTSTASSSNTKGAKKKHKYRPENEFSFIDYDNNQFTKHRKHKRTASETGRFPKFGQGGSLDTARDLISVAYSKKSKRRHKKSKHGRYKTCTTHSAFSTSHIFHSSAARNEPDLKLHRNPSLPLSMAMGVSAGPPSSSSIMSKANNSVIVLSALKKQLNEVDDNEDGSIDWEEFKEVLSTLHSSLQGVKASKLFYAMADLKTHELDIEHFLQRIERTFKLHAHITGDECVEKVATAEMKGNHARNFSLGASSTTSSLEFTNVVSSGGTVRELYADEIDENKENTPCPGPIPAMLDIDDEKLDIGAAMDHELNMITEAQQILDGCDSDEDGLIDKTQFVDFLSEWRLDERLTPNEIDLVFSQLIHRHDDDEDSEEEEEQSMASCDLIMHRLHQVRADHPHYSTRRAIYRICRRLLKMAQK